MSDLQLSLLLDSIMFVLLALRIHRSEIYESGTFLRMALFLGACWLLFADIDGMTAFWDIVTGWPGSFERTGVFKLVVIAGILIEERNDIGPVLRAVRQKGKSL
jgi:hypothetical protein